VAIEHLVPEEYVTVGAPSTVAMFDQASLFECPEVAPNLALTLAEFRG
jgi:hypothetical protein